MIDIYIFYGADKTDPETHPTRKANTGDGNAVISKFKTLVPKLYTPEQLKEFRIHYVNDAKRQSIIIGGRNYTTLNHGIEFVTLNDLLQIANTIIVDRYYDKNNH